MGNPILHSPNDPCHPRHPWFPVCFPQFVFELMAELRPALPDDDWDKQMKADAASGKLDFIDRNVEKARQEGTLIPLERILEEDVAQII